MKIFVVLFTLFSVGLLVYIPWKDRREKRLKKLREEEFLRSLCWLESMNCGRITLEQFRDAGKRGFPTSRGGGLVFPPK